jgi:hypothetical protein
MADNPSAASPTNPFFARFWAHEAALNFSTERALDKDRQNEKRPREEPRPGYFSQSGRDGSGDIVA